MIEPGCAWGEKAMDLIFAERVVALYGYQCAVLAADQWWLPRWLPLLRWNRGGDTT